MKRKRNLILGQRNLVVVLLALMLIISSVLTACGSSTATTAPETKEEVVVGNEEEQVEVEEATKEKAVQETLEVVEQSIEKIQSPQSLSEWLQTVDTSEPKMAIWNNVTKEGIFLENEQKYVLKEGDVLVICTEEKENGLEIHSTISVDDFKTRISEKYITFDFLKKKKL